MNRYAYLATGHLISIMESLSKVNVIIHGQENIPDGSSIIFVVNHFTRIETILLPYHIYCLNKVPVWSLADNSFFKGPLSSFLETVGAVSTRDPDRDRLIVKSLLTGEANWIIFPEGYMVKDKGSIRRIPFFGAVGNGPGRPHTGAATLALRTEFYRQRLKHLATTLPSEAERLQHLFQIKDLTPVLHRKTVIMPVNITYYPLRARENALSQLADLFISDMSDRLREEIVTEGSMLLSGVDIDIRFGQPQQVNGHLDHSLIHQDMKSTVPINFDDHLPSRPAMQRAASRIMDGYMSAIYNMTTINHDHLFASLLKAIPFSRMSEDDFRRRVFLLTSFFLERDSIHCHSSLQFGQIALLTDDRYHKYQDFLMLATEKGIVRQEQGVLTKDKRRFTASVNFHRARLDNPLGVITNEVASLKPLQRQVRLLAWLPATFSRGRVADLLLRQATREFEADYLEFYQAGETKGRDVGAPVLLKGRSQDLGIVLVHGYLAAPREMAELAAFLHGKGYWVYSVRLKGHGTSPADLAGRSAPEWVESVDLGYALMSSLCRRVAVGGFSFGGGLALDCAARIGTVAATFAVCPPLRLLDMGSRFAPALATWNKLMETFHCPEGKKDFVHIVPEHPDINYARVPIAGLHELLHFMSELELKLADIRLPVLVVQSAGDPVVDPAATEALYEKLGSQQKSYRTVQLDRHGIVSGEGSEPVHLAIGDFLDSVRLDRHPTPEQPAETAPLMALQPDPSQESSPALPVGIEMP